MGDSALHVSLSQGHFSVAQYLLQQFSSPTTPPSSSSSINLMSSSASFSLTRSMNASFLDLTNKYGDTALMLTAEKGHYDIVQYLLRQQVNINVSNTVSF